MFFECVEKFFGFYFLFSSSFVVSFGERFFGIYGVLLSFRFLIGLALFFIWVRIISVLFVGVRGEVCVFSFFLVSSYWRGGILEMGVFGR